MGTARNAIARRATESCGVEQHLRSVGIAAEQRLTIRRFTELDFTSTKEGYRTGATRKLVDRGRATVSGGKALISTIEAHVTN